MKGFARVDILWGVGVRGEGKVCGAPCKGFLDSGEGQRGRSVRFRRRAVAARRTRLIDRAQPPLSRTVCPLYCSAQCVLYLIKYFAV